jgi:predicted membrane protein
VGPTREAAVLKILLIIVVILAILWVARSFMGRGGGHGV